MFEAELAYFIAHQEELVQKYDGRYLVLRGSEVMGAFDTALEAYQEASTQFPAGSFMIQPCESGPEAYTVTLRANAVGASAQG